MFLNERGFTLPEVIAAAAMLGAAIYLSSFVSDSIANGYQSTRRVSRAHEVASLTLEELLSTFSSDAKLQNGDHTQEFDTELKKVAAGGVYKAAWTVTWNFPITKIMQISLRVSWDDKGHERGVRYLTYRSL
ncbi:MAG: prepilin-type N-terminal cleavage/methylation domain-containing protein [Bdellovibrionales bacterium]